MTLTASEIHRIKALFGPNGEHWTQNTPARNAEGNYTHPNSSDAVKWCLLGACQCLHIHPLRLREAMLMGLKEDPKKFALGNWNDSRPFTDVVMGLNKVHLYLVENNFL